MEPTGYPSFVLYLILLIGMPLALAKPFKALLLVAFLLASADAAAFTYTRTDFLGPYFNAHDACLLIALIAILTYVLFQAKKIFFPKVANWIIAVLLIGFVQSWFVMGWTYEALRALRQALNVPIYFIIAATMVDKEEKVRPLLIALFLGSVVSAIEHLVFVRSSVDLYELTGGDIGQLRTIAFRSPGLFFLLAGLIWLPKFKGIDRKLLLIAGALFAISVVLNQTRSIWISSIAVLPISFMLFQNRNIFSPVIIKNIILTMLLVVAIIFITIKIIAPEIDLADIVLQRFGIFSEENMRYQQTITRVLAFKMELEAWLSGTLIFGRGLAFFAPYLVFDSPIAWGHLGHVTTLAQLGIIGLAVYSFYLPAVIVKSSLILWRNTNNEVKFFGLLAGISIIWYWICFLMSDSFLGQHPLAGVIFGVVWRHAELIKTDKVHLRQKIITTELI